MTTTIPFSDLDATAHAGQRVRITRPGEEPRVGTLFIAQNPAYTIEVRHWFLSVTSQHPLFEHDAVSLQWMSPNATVEFLTEPARVARYLLVELPLPADDDPEEVHASAQSDLHAYLSEDVRLADGPVVTLVHPGDVVAPEDTTEHERMRALVSAVEATGQGDDDPLIDAMRDALTLALTRWPGVLDERMVTEPAPEPETCEAFARVGTGTGTCGEPLDASGQCGTPRRHLYL